MASLEQFTLRIGGDSVRGHWHAPTEPSHRGILSLHGFAGDSVGPHRLFTEFAKGACDRGWHVLRFDYRGRGYSDGDAASVSFEGMSSDALAAAEAFVDMAGLTHLALVGLCAGALVALSIAAPAHAHALVLWSPDPFPSAPVQGESGRRVPWRAFASRSAHYLRRLTSRETWFRLWRGQVDILGVGKVLGRSLATERTHSAKPIWNHVRRELEHGADGGFGPAPILMVLADRDPASPNVDRLYRAAMEPERRSHRIDWVRGADHNFLSRAAHRYLFSSTISFLESPSETPHRDGAAPGEEESPAKPPEL